MQWKNWRAKEVASEEASVGITYGKFEFHLAARSTESCGPTPARRDRSPRLVTEKPNMLVVPSAPNSSTAPPLRNLEPT